MNVKQDILGNYIFAVRYDGYKHPRAVDFNHKGLMSRVYVKTPSVMDALRKYAPDMIANGNRITWRRATWGRERMIVNIMHKGICHTYTITWGDP